MEIPMTLGPNPMYRGPGRVSTSSSAWKRSRGVGVTVNSGISSPLVNDRLLVFRPIPGVIIMDGLSGAEPAHKGTMEEQKRRRTRTEENRRGPLGKAAVITHLVRVVEPQRTGLWSERRKNRNITVSHGDE